MYQGNYDKLTNKCKTIIKNNDPADCIKLIAKLKNPNTNLSIGKNNAYKIYVLYVDESVTYTEKKYGNNITLYKNKIRKNIDIAAQSI